MRNHKHVSLFWQSAWVKQEIFCAARSSSSFFHLLICNLKTQSCIRQKSACITSSLVTLILIFIFSLMFKWYYTLLNMILFIKYEIFLMIKWQSYVYLFVVLRIRITNLHFLFIIIFYYFTRFMEAVNLYLHR